MMRAYCKLPFELQRVPVAPSYLAVSEGDLFTITI